LTKMIDNLPRGQFDRFMVEQQVLEPNDVPIAEGTNHQETAPKLWVATVQWVTAIDGDARKLGSHALEGDAMNDDPLKPHAPPLASGAS
jgi:hypothetical protein